MRIRVCMIPTSALPFLFHARCGLEGRRDEMGGWNCIALVTCFLECVTDHMVDPRGSAEAQHARSRRL